MVSTYDKKLIIKQIVKRTDLESDLIDTQELDSSLSYQECKREAFEKFGVSEQLPYDLDYIKHLKVQQEKKFKKYHRSRFKRITKEAYRNGLNMQSIFKECRVTKRKPIKDIHYRRLRLTPLRKRKDTYSFARALSMCPSYSQ